MVSYLIHYILRWFPCLRNPRLIWMSTYPWNSHPNLPSIRYPIGCRQSLVDLGLLGILLTKQFRARYLLLHTQLHTCMLQQCHYTWMFSSPPHFPPIHIPPLLFTYVHTPLLHTHTLIKDGIFVIHIRSRRPIKECLRSIVTGSSKSWEILEEFKAPTIVVMCMCIAT